VKAFLNPLFGAVTLQTTTSSVYPVVIVNGPIGRQIRLNSGYGCLGPDPAHPAGAIIGRALRLIQQNIGGAIPGSGTMAIYGGPLDLPILFLPKMKMGYLQAGKF